MVSGSLDVPAFTAGLMIGIAFTCGIFVVIYTWTKRWEDKRNERFR